MKRLLCGVSAVLLSAALTISASAKSTLFYSKTSTGQEYAANMPKWNGVAGTFAEQTPDGVRIGTKEAGGAMFSFPTYLDPALNDWSGAKYVEIDVTNEKKFGTHLAVIIMDNVTRDANYGHEMFQLKANSPAYIKDKQGNVLKRTSFGNGVFIPRGFKGKLYIPLDMKYLETLSWATKDGELDKKHISNIAYILNDANASVMIGDVFKTDDDPSKLVKPTKKAAVSTKLIRMSITAATVAAKPTGHASEAGSATSSFSGPAAGPSTESTAASGAVSTAFTSAAPTHVNGKSGGSLWTILGLVFGSAVLVVAGAFVFLYMKKKKSA